MRVHRNMLARMSGVLLLAGSMVVVSAARADATLIVWVCDDPVCAAGGAFTDFAVADQGVFDSSDGTVGAVTFFTTGGGTVTANSYPNLGSMTEPTLNLTYSLNAAAFASFGGTPYIFAAQDGFTASSGPAAFNANASLGSGTASLYVGSGSFGPSPLTAAPVFDCALVPLACLGGAPVPPSDYFLAIGVAPTTPNGGASGDASVIVSPQQTVPDGGATATLLGSVLLGFGILRRKFRR